MNGRFEIRRLVSDAEIASAFGVMAQLRPQLLEAEFVEVVRAQEREGYELIGLFDEGRVVCAAGIRPGRTLSRGPHLFVDDLVTLAEARGRGHGRAMLRHLAGLARERGLAAIWLDSRDSAVSFYEQAGFAMHTSVPCRIAVAELLQEGENAPS